MELIHIIENPKGTFRSEINVTVKEWEDILQEMCKHLYMMDEDNVAEFLKTGMPEGWEPAINSVYEIMERHKNEFFDLMKKHFYDLWY